MKKDMNKSAMKNTKGGKFQGLCLFHITYVSMTGGATLSETASEPGELTNMYLTEKIKSATPRRYL